MIITKTPFRISFSGGGTDLPAFYNQEQGAVLSTSIDKYMYIMIHPYFDRKKIFLKYSVTEIVDHFSDIQHPIYKQILFDQKLNGIDITSIADIPSGTGLGSSGSFTVGVLNAVHSYQNKFISSSELALEACKIEIEKLGNLIGKQDQYAASYGGLNLIEFHSDETVNVKKIMMDPAKKAELESNLFLIYTGKDHSAKDLLAKQSEITVSKNDKFQNLKEMVKLTYCLKDTLINNNIDDFGRILHEGWLLKKSLMKSISNELIDTIYSKGIKSGASGGKLLGAGAGGFILFYVPVETQDEFKKEMSCYKDMKFKFDHFGSKVIYVGPKLSFR